MTAPVSLDAVNAMPLADFVGLLAPVFEKAPWIATAAAAARPFATVKALHEAMFAAIAVTPEAMRLGFIRGHPDLGGSAARTRAMTDESVAEQSSLGLDRLPDAQFAHFQSINDAYRARFGFPFMICVRRHTRASILVEFERRLHNDAETELAAAMHEVFLITRLRLVDLVEGPGLPHTKGHLSTHVLNTATGRPASGVEVELFEVDDQDTASLTRAVTNEEGRTAEPLLAGAPLRIGSYELRFHVAHYFAAIAGAHPAFLSVIPVRFAIAEPEGRYHIPLLVTPWSYSTYRGS